MQVKKAFTHQGFYLYRNGRLISEPTWFGLEKKTPKRKLCRVKIDIDNSNDVIWQLDVKKVRLCHLHL